MLDRLVARIPALLLLGVVGLTIAVAYLVVDRPLIVLSAIPAAFVLVAYLRAGRGAR